MGGETPRRAVPLLTLLLLAAALLLFGLTAGSSGALLVDADNVGSNVFNADTLDAPTGVAGAPVGEGAIGLSWIATVDTYASGYQVLRSLTSGGPYTQVATVTPQSATSHQDTGLISGKTYYYVERSYFNNWESADSNQTSAAPPDFLRLLEDDVTMSKATTPAGNIDTNALATDYFKADFPVTYASNAADWTLVLVQRDKPGVAAPSTISVWWQSGGACSTGAVAGQIFATASITVPIAVDKKGESFTITKTAGSVSRAFASGDLLCLSIRADASGSSNDLHYYANTASTSGTSGVTRLIGPFTTNGRLNLHEDDVSMSTNYPTGGNIDTNALATDYFTNTTPFTYASNDSDWTLVLVLRDKPDVAAPATINVWWQSGGACSTGAVAGQIFATASITVPIAVDKKGESFTIAKTAGSVSRTFVAGDILCLSIRADGSGSSNDLHYYANTASTSGTSGITRLEGPFHQ